MTIKKSGFSQTARNKGIKMYSEGASAEDISNALAVCMSSVNKSIAYWIENDLVIPQDDFVEPIEDEVLDDDFDEDDDED
jgi:hypothetical protein